MQPDVVTFSVAREPDGWFITEPYRMGPFPSRRAVAEAAEVLASWVRAGGEEARVVDQPALY
jgi:hypothetical protein